MLLVRLKLIRPEIIMEFETKEINGITLYSGEGTQSYCNDNKGPRTQTLWVGKKFNNMWFIPNGYASEWEISEMREFELKEYNTRPEETKKRPEWNNGYRNRMAMCGECNHLGELIDFREFSGVCGDWGGSVCPNCEEVILTYGYDKFRDFLEYIDKKRK